MAEKRHPVPDWLLERLVAADLPGKAAAELRARLAAHTQPSRSGGAPGEPLGFRVAGPRAELGRRFAPGARLVTGPRARRCSARVTRAAERRAADRASDGERADVPDRTLPNGPPAKSSNQIGIGTFGPQHLVPLLSYAVHLAFEAVWFQKWAVHRRLRPEEYGGQLGGEVAQQGRAAAQQDCAGGEREAAADLINGKGRGSTRPSGSGRPGLEASQGGGAWDPFLQRDPVRQRATRDRALAPARGLAGEVGTVCS
jgi:hypothetical protein